jgi:glycosyltransferase involved in cell wall biosynthesis
LAAAGYDVVLIAPGKSLPLPAGVRFRGVRAARNRLERVTRTVGEVFRAALAERADVYHFHDPELMAVGLALRALGARVIFDVHEDIPSDIADKPWIPKRLRGPVAAVAALALRTMHRGYNGIVTATPAIAKRFRHARTVVVCNYPRLDELPGSDGRSFSERPRSVLYLGSITELRCLQEMLQALASPSLDAGIRLVLAGTFEDESLERRARLHEGWNRVEYLGHCSRARVPEVLSGARAGILLFRKAANHDDAMPNKLFEYLGAGLPVIISDTLRASAIVRRHDCGVVVDPNDPHAVAAAITSLVNSPDAAQAMGERGRLLVRERYQWSSEASKLTRLYAEIA